MNLSEIAKLAGVSTATVSRVINDDDRVTEKTRNKVTKIIEQYAYVQNANARNLRTSTSKSIGFLISNFQNPFFIDLYSGFEPMCKRNHYNIIIGNTNEDVEQEKEAIELLLRYRVDGIVASFVGPSEGTLNKIKRLGVKVVSLDRQLENLESDLIAIDNINGAMQQVEYLANLGHRKISLISGTSFDSNGKNRLKGFIKGMEKCKIPVNPDYIVSGDFLEERAYSAAVELMHREQRPTAIITHNNLMCIGAYKALKDMGVKIPEEVSLVGFDDFVFSQHLQPSITLIDRPVKEMGELAGKMIIDRIEGKYQGAPREIIFPVHLRQGGSCMRIL
ncbi:MAG: LacI family DNA-binding transcriptional regulator [Blautia sp.]|jgi:LacI family transcriptional regulator